MLHEAASGHPGGSLSAVEIVRALYFGGFLRYDPARPNWPDRDRFEAYDIEAAARRILDRRDAGAKAFMLSSGRDV